MEINLKYFPERVLVSLLCIFLFINIAHGSEEKKSNTAIDTLTHHEIKIGQRLFHGLIPGKKDCSACHATGPTDTINWNPSAEDIAAIYKDKSTEDLEKVLLEPTGKKISEVHQNINLSEEEIVLMKGYLDHFKIPAFKKQKLNIAGIVLFLISVLIAFGVTLDLVFFRKIKRKAIHLILLSVLGTYQIAVLATEAIDLGRSEGYMPDQPLKFSHQVHVTENKIDCRYCHNIVDESKSSGIPSNNVCMNCHVLVREGSRSGTFEIGKLLASNNNEKPIEWIRVHNLPDHVYFNHAQHTKVAGIDCSHCHGNVENMHVIQQVRDLSMGWCVNCHRETKVAFHSNEFYKQYPDLKEKMQTGEIDSVTVEMVGGIDCMKCHY